MRRADVPHQADPQTAPEPADELPGRPDEVAAPGDRRLRALTDAAIAAEEIQDDADPQVQIDLGMVTPVQRDGGLADLGLADEEPELEPADEPSGEFLSEDVPDEHQAQSASRAARTARSRAGRSRAGRRAVQRVAAGSPGSATSAPHDEPEHGEPEHGEPEHGDSEDVDSAHSELQLSAPLPNESPENGSSEDESLRSEPELGDGGLDDGDTGFGEDRTGFSEPGLASAERAQRHVEAGRPDFDGSASAAYDAGAAQEAGVAYDAGAGYGADAIYDVSAGYDAGADYDDVVGELGLRDEAADEAEHNSGFVVTGAGAGVMAGRGSARFEADTAPVSRRDTQPLDREPADDGRFAQVGSRFGDPRYGDRVDGWVRPHYPDEADEEVSGEYWTPVRASEYGDGYDDNEPGYGWPVPVERLAPVPSRFDPVSEEAEPTAVVPQWPPTRPSGRIELPRSWGERNKKEPQPNVNEPYRSAAEINEPGRRGMLVRRTARADRRRGAATEFMPKLADSTQMLPSVPEPEPARSRPRPRPRPSQPDSRSTVYRSRHAADPT